MGSTDKETGQAPYSCLHWGPAGTQKIGKGKKSANASLCILHQATHTADREHRYVHTQQHSMSTFLLFFFLFFFDTPKIAVHLSLAVYTLHSAMYFLTY